MQLFLFKFLLLITFCIQRTNGWLNNKLKLRKFYSSLPTMLLTKVQPDYEGEISTTNSNIKLPLFILSINTKYEFDPINRPDKLKKWITDNGITDLWVISHGLLTSRDEAVNNNYEALFENVNLTSLATTDRNFGVVGISWVSIKKLLFKKLLFSETSRANIRLKNDTDDDSINDTNEFIDQINDLTASFPDEKDEINNYFDTMKELKRMQKKFLPQDQKSNNNMSAATSPGNDDNDEIKEVDIQYCLELINRIVMTDLKVDSSVLPNKFDLKVDSMAVLPNDNRLDPTESSQSEKNNLISFFENFNEIVGSALAVKLLKGRAAQTGIKLAPTLDKLIEGKPGLQIHLVGHSFGALLVSATALVSRASSGYASMTLLQGAFCTNSFTEELKFYSVPGMFNNVLKNMTVNGPIVVTHTKNDEILTIFYRSAAWFYTTFFGNNDKKPWYGVKIPVFGAGEPSIVSNARIRPMGTDENERLITAIGVDGASSLADTVCKHWSSMASFDSEKVDNIIVHNLKSDDKIEDHNKVWNADVARLLVQVIIASEKFLPEK